MCARQWHARDGISLLLRDGFVGISLLFAKVRMQHRMHRWLSWGHHHLLEDLRDLLDLAGDRLAQFRPAATMLVYARAQLARPQGPPPNIHPTNLQTQIPRY